MPYEKNKYIVLAESCSIRLLDKPFVYNKRTDELYEMGEPAACLLCKCDGTATVGGLGADHGFVEYCLKEGILELTDWPNKRHITCRESEAPMLRYLELHLTNRCNLACRHCYLSAGEGNDLELIKVFKVFEEFDALQGLRLMLSGGEPLLHRNFWYINERLNDYGFRAILLTNGTLVTKEIAERLKCHEAQVSLDGMQASHDILRGQGSFAKAVKGIENLLAAGIKTSVATMATTLNKSEFEDMKELVNSLGVSEWTVDAPSMSGRLLENASLMLPPQESGPLLNYGFGGGIHSGPEGFACGSNLMAVGSNGSVAKCGFYMGKPAGNLSEGLAACWKRLKPLRLDELGCSCEHKAECRGGCRFRAESYGCGRGADPVKCHAFGIKSNEGGACDDHN
jgi:radical SAM protein with 4Fe4S-binding SPASM domain